MIPVIIQILKLLPVLAPFASNFSALKSGIEQALSRLTDLENNHRNIGNGDW